MSGLRGFIVIYLLFNLTIFVLVCSESPGGYLSGLSMEVSEDIFGALLAACMRSGEAAGAAEAVSILKSHGIRVSSCSVDHLYVHEKCTLSAYATCFCQFFSLYISIKCYYLDKKIMFLKLYL